LGDVVRSAHRFSEIQQFVGKQGEKAKRAGRMDVQDYWVAVEKALHGLRKDAENLWQEAVPPPAKVSEKSVLDALHCKLAAEFVRHLIAHSLYWSPLPKKEK
jgi:hypothetical protein